MSAIRLTSKKAVFDSSNLEADGPLPAQMLPLRTTTASVSLRDMQDGDVAQERTTHLREKNTVMKAKLRELKAREAEVTVHPDKQISRTDSDARAMRTSLKASGMVGYNV